MLSSLVSISMPFSDFSENIYYCVNHSSDDDNWICGHDVCPLLLIQLSLEPTKISTYQFFLKPNNIIEVLREEINKKTVRAILAKERWGRFLWWLTTPSRPYLCSNRAISIMLQNYIKVCLLNSNKIVGVWPLTIFLSVSDTITWFLLIWLSEWQLWRRFEQKYFSPPVLLLGLLDRQIILVWICYEHMSYLGFAPK